ncbi:FAD-dependent oxidoreductase [Rhizobium sp. RCAM05350]|nr:FAD-dependent oxidoreductase [Rhizobium sp. RCAM05350]
MMGRLTRRVLLAGASAGLGIYAGRTLLAPTSASGPIFPVDIKPENGGILLNDASELSPTSVAKHITVTADPMAETIDAIRTMMAEARGAGQSFAASAARHSMGGQSLAKSGTVLTLDQQWLEADTAARTYRVAAGTRWSTVIARLDAIGFSPAVMQSNNDFGVASTYSVNAHGWPVRFSGCSSTVRSVKMLLADGTLITCSRSENAETVPACHGWLRPFRRHHRA